MPAFTIGDIVRGTRGALLGGDLGIAVAGISIDSRSLGVGDAFFAIRGERLDGHGFLRDTVGRGAACLVIHSVPDDLPPGVPVVLVHPASGSGLEFTSQLFFDDGVIDKIHAQQPYAQKGQRTLRNAGDGIYQGGGDQLLLNLSGDAGSGYASTFDIGLQVA